MLGAGSDSSEAAIASLPSYEEEGGPWLSPFAAWGAAEGADASLAVQRMKFTSQSARMAAAGNGSAYEPNAEHS